MSALRSLIESAMQRTQTALEGGPQIDAATEYAAARQMLAELDELERGRLWPAQSTTDDGA